MGTLWRGGGVRFPPNKTNNSVAPNSSWQGLSRPPKLPVSAEVMDGRHTAGQDKKGRCRGRGVRDSVKTKISMLRAEVIRNPALAAGKDEQCSRW
jgi:hypothetical protein